MYVDHSIYKLPTEVREQSIYDKLKYNLIKKFKKYSINPVIILSGFSDCVLLDKDKIIWPWFDYPSERKSAKLMVNWDSGSIRSNKQLTCIFKEEYSKFHLFIKHLNTLGYKNNYNYKVIPYDFRIVGDPGYMSHLLNYFKKYLIYLFQNSSHKVIIISYDFGCVITQILLNNLDYKFKEQFVDKFIMINPTLGGNIYALRHCPNNLFYCFTGIHLQLPSKKYYGNINDNFFNSVPFKIKYFYDKVIVKFQDKSLKDPNVDIVIIRNIYCMDIIGNILENIISSFSRCKLINVRIKNDNSILLNNKVINKLIQYITN